ncbi:NADH:flavin oxidoreductase/NADH oxidase [Leucobacter luti]|uniref:NADH:flavin oxidoreductase/NADH oxidase n=1 Tax=Leucobacter luti TaxID=340320 RepID=UPI001048C4CF|nr:NADH:flavin oxidoreductase/NADH oxidase [Leucobacter luti]MCW2288201.1 2,4-dienoyl-CoA reductase-like NADH-dependent reductase (Old Yellow Enzyme family) [Leucobacter luti]QYM75839.1 NADH:flavin oxidoreductase/NADH oxidase [Leucobacter luti]TCK45639.1 2,4-dienoyl-CoA reductase-like NADH-dependent reductase (Old Yellow Enzyme family) [Leucobacter luti]
MADPYLFRPFTLRGMEVRNRLWVAPMCQYSVTELDGIPRDWHLVHVGALARGGAGLVTLEATAVTAEGRISPRDLGLWSDEHTPAFARLAEIAHAHGARISVQLAHAGRKASTYPALPGFPAGTQPSSEGGWETVAPSAVPFGDFTTPRALEVPELHSITAAFVAAAGRAVAAGFDAIEVHAAHGYLLHEFLSPLSNLRDDGYGGDLAGRARLLRETVRAIRGAHPELPVVVRLSATEWVDGGFDLAESGVVVAWLAEDGADLIDVSSAANLPSAPIPVGPSYQVPLAASLRQGPLPVGAVGLITSAEQAEAILSTGQADVVYLGRPLLANPHLPISWAHELRAPVAAELVPAPYHRARF